MEINSDTVPGTVLGYSKTNDAKVVKYQGRYYFYLDGAGVGSTNELRTAQYWAKKFGVNLDEGELGEAANGQREMYGQSFKKKPLTSAWANYVLSGTTYEVLSDEFTLSGPSGATTTLNDLVNRGLPGNTPVTVDGEKVDRLDTIYPAGTVIVVG